jgi:hypothetical protein
MVNALPLSETSNIRVFWREEQPPGRVSQTAFYSYQAETPIFSLLLNIPNTTLSIDFAYLTKDKGVYHSNENLQMDFYQYELEKGITKNYGNSWRGF